VQPEVVQRPVELLLPKCAALARVISVVKVWTTFRTILTRAGDESFSKSTIKQDCTQTHLLVPVGQIRKFSANNS
jgi:hypothetical protein